MVLWHGAWRGKKGETPDAKSGSDGAKDGSDDAKDGSGDAKTPTAAAKPDVAAPQAFSVLIDADDAGSARLAGELLAVLQPGGAKGLVVTGRTSPAALAKAVQSDSADLAIAPMDALIAADKATADWRDRSPYVVQLGAEPVEIVASRSVTDVHALAGRDVGFGASDGAGAATAATLFSHLGIAANPSYGTLDSALADLAAGKLAAVVAVGAQSTKAMADLGKDGRFHVVSIPWNPALQSLYTPVRLTAKDQPALIGADEKIDTLAAPRALIAVDAAPSSPRADHLADLTKSLFEGFDKLLGPDNDATWQNVNLAAGAAWPRLPAVQAWIDAKAMRSSPSLDAFRATAKTVSLTTGGPGPQDSDRLYDSLMQWRNEAH
ncbi:MAG: hypothetical protein JO107_14710 [Hyphomicrobiales bacterium]|nr:hypothetical protein [Hyphomicrobiales bacterium]